MEMTIGSNIKRLRTAKNITQEQLAEVMNVTCAAVSKWERGETYPDITLLQPLAYYFNVTLDDLMGYDHTKVQADIENAIALYDQHRYSDRQKARDIITKAYHDYPNDYRIMHCYMWNIGGDMADNDPDVLIANKDEFLSICGKILDGCTDEILRLNAWNMRAKILHAEGKTEEAMEIYNTRFANWYATSGQKSEQLFAKNTDDYYSWVRKNMYDLIDFAGDKLGRVVFFDKELSLKEKTEKALKYGDLILNVFAETNDPFFALLAFSFIRRMENDLFYRGGSDDNIIAASDKYLEAAEKFSECLSKNETLREAYAAQRASVPTDLFGWILDSHLSGERGQRPELLENPEYMKVLNKYKQQR